tara:strand:+ start:1796 stop:2005 length:210 start_codon:yes stop_codon:yes gene_type:complete
MNFKKYKKNLTIDGDFVISYETKVAQINHVTGTVHVLGWYSSTTSKHINYAADQLGYEVKKSTIDGTEV